MAPRIKKNAAVPADVTSHANCLYYSTTQGTNCPLMLRIVVPLCGEWRALEIAIREGATISYDDIRFEDTNPPSGCRGEMSVIDRQGDRDE